MHCRISGRPPGRAALHAGLLEHGAECEGALPHDANDLRREVRYPVLKHLTTIVIGLIGDNFPIRQFAAGASATTLYATAVCVPGFRYPCF